MYGIPINICPDIYWAYVSLEWGSIQTAKPNLMNYKSVEMQNMYLIWKEIYIFYIIPFI